MNIMQVLPLVTKFIADPKAGVLEVEKMILPLWVQLEQQAGGELSVMLSRSDDATSITVSFWTSPTPEQRNLWRAYSLPQLVDELKNIKNFNPDAVSTKYIPEQTGTTDDAGTEPDATKNGSEPGNAVAIATEHTGGESGTEGGC